MLSRIDSRFGNCLNTPVRSHCPGAVSKEASPQFAGLFSGQDVANIQPKAEFRKAIQEARALGPGIENLYQASYDNVAPTVIGATDQVLRQASAKKGHDPHVLFIARDGIGGYKIAQNLLKRFPERYPGLTENSVHYVYLNGDTVYSPLANDYLKQECNLTKDSSVFTFDIGWLGSMDYSLKNLIDGSLGKYQGLNLVFSPRDKGTLHPYINLSSVKNSPFGSIVMNPAVCFLEDTYSGLETRADRLIRDASGKIVPDIPSSPYSGEILDKRVWALKALTDASRDISLKELDSITPQSATRKLLELMSEPGKYQPLAVPHEGF